MEQSLKGKTALVTGASRGIGQAAAVRLAADGAFVFVNYAHGKSEAEATVAAIKKSGGRALALQGDLSQTANIKKMFSEIDSLLKAEGFKQIDILVNNAGVYPMGGLEDTTEENFDKTFDVNVKGLFFTTQEAAKRMGMGGRVINISTTLTRVGSSSMIAYAASKGAVDILTRDFAIGLGAKGITVNAINPGLIYTDGTLGMTSNPDTVNYITSQTALGRLGEPKDVADIIAFLASDQSRWVTAQHIEASGGYHL